MTAMTEPADRNPQSRTRPQADRRGSFPERLNYLFATVHAPGRRPYSAAEVARWINDNGGQQISAVYILKLLGGERLNPHPRYVHQLARFFCVEEDFFTVEDPPALDGTALDAQIRVRNQTVQSMLVRATQLSPRSQEALSDIIDSLLRAEGKTP